VYVLNGVFGAESSPQVWEGLPPVDFYTSAYVALVVATVGVLALPVHLSGYREQGVLRWFRASALPPGVLVTAHGLVAVVMGTVGAALLVVVSRLGYDATPPQDWP
jgi:ABC-2 type transport system permease protein